MDVFEKMENEKKSKIDEISEVAEPSLKLRHTLSF